MGDSNTRWVYVDIGFGGACMPVIEYNGNQGREQDVCVGTVHSN